nr:MAG TPA: STRUCTURAL MAINTENANCE OF CHROMOSOMES PROTEIN [Caudoviricetes sp.]
MNIKSVKTRQFAGIKNKEVEFEDGLNVLVGNNETGKSTMVELIYQTLYRDSKLSRSKKEDKDFIARFMPSDSKGDVVDGTLVFATADGLYTLQKKWGASEMCELESSNDGIIANEKKIREIIDGELVYKRGLYDDVVFASQKSQANVVEHILNKLDKKALVKQDLVSIIASEGMSSTEGIAPEEIEKIIQEKIDALSGHWDFANDGPDKKRGIGNKWVQGVGAILEAYYTKAELEDALQKSEVAEKAIDIDNNKINEAKEKLEEYRTEQREYDHYARVIDARNNNMKLKDEYLEKKKKIDKDLEKYPQFLKDYSEALRLKTLNNAREIISKYKKIQAAKDSLNEAKKSIEGKKEIAVEDEEKLSKLEQRIKDLQAKLSNLDLVANIKKLGNTDIQIKSVATGKNIDISAGEFAIDETVEITVPGVMNMTIAPKGVDVEDVQRQLDRSIKESEALLSKYSVKDLDELITKESEYKEAFHNLSDAQKDYDALIEGIDLDKLDEDYARHKEKYSELDGLDKKIADLCGTESIVSYVAKLEQQDKSIREEYDANKPAECMKEKLKIVNSDLDKCYMQENDAANIPEKYCNIKDGDIYRKTLEDNIDDATNQIEKAKDDLNEHKKELGDVAPEDLRTQIDDATIEFQKLKDDCERWNHILAVLKATRENMAGESTMSDVQDRFAEYLSIITDGRIALKSMDENMDVNIQSGNNHMTYEILSEGTKDTIALAFRLAILEHLFPDGGGLVVFDDPFTEMDENRTKQACKLVQKFANAGNQVIFVTCDNKYRSILSGNVVEL